MFYEAVALMIGADADAGRRAAYLERLMGPPNATWGGVVADADADPASLTAHTHTARSVTNILATNLAVVSALGPPYAPQMARLFPDLVRVYQAYSGAVSAAVSAGGPHAGRTAAVKAARGAQRAALKLIEAFIEGAADPADLVARYLPAAAGPILADYAACPPDAREPGVLALYAAAITRLGGGGGGGGAAPPGTSSADASPSPAADLVPSVFAAVFGPTLSMLTANFEDFPEHRLQFFGLLRSVAAAATPALFALSSDQLRLLVDAVCWAVRTPERTVADTGLHLLLDLVTAFEASPYAAPFYRTYHARLVAEVLAVLTDTFHKPGFKLHARLLHHLIGVADPVAGLQAPLWGGPADLAAAGLPPDPPPASNAAFLAASLTSLLAASFPNLSPPQAEAAVAGMFGARGDFGAFKEHLRDVLVLTKVVAPADAADLGGDAAAAAAAATAAAMAAIPGMVHDGAGRPAAAAAAVTGGGEGGGGMAG
jgi:exportin-1